MTTRIPRRTLVTVCIVAVVLAISLPALAAVSKSGTKTCPGRETPWTRAYSTQFTEHYPPGSGWGWFDNGSSWKVTRLSAPMHSNGGYWIVETNGALDNPGTYAYCSAVE